MSPNQALVLDPDLDLDLVLVLDQPIAPGSPGKSKVRVLAPGLVYFSIRPDPPPSIPFQVVIHGPSRTEEPEFRPTRSWTST